MRYRRNNALLLGLSAWLLAGCAVTGAGSGPDTGGSQLIAPERSIVHLPEELVQARLAVRRQVEGGQWLERVILDNNTAVPRENAIIVQTVGATNPHTETSIGRRVNLEFEDWQKVSPPLDRVNARGPHRYIEAADEEVQWRATMTKPETPAPIARLFARDVSPQEARQAEAAVLSERDAAGAERLGWIYFDAGTWSSARDWFERALAWKPTAKAAEGLARAQAKLGAYQQVETLAASWPEAVGPLLESLRLEWITRAYEQGDHRTLLAQTAALATPPAWNLRAWTYLQLERPTEAGLAFERVLNDDRALPSERREAAFGLARTHLALGNLDDALLVTRVHPLTREQIHEVRAEVLARQAGVAFKRKDYQTSLALLEERRSLAEPSRDLLIQEAWTRHHLRQRQVAKRMFTDLDRIYSTRETREGLKVVDQSMNRFGS